MTRAVSLTAIEVSLAINVNHKVSRGYVVLDWPNNFFATSLKC